MGPIWGSWLPGWEIPVLNHTTTLPHFLGTLIPCLFLHLGKRGEDTIWPSCQWNIGKLSYFLLIQNSSCRQIMESIPSFFVSYIIVKPRSNMQHPLSLCPLFFLSPTGHGAVYKKLISKSELVYRVPCFQLLFSFYFLSNMLGQTKTATTLIA